MCVLPDFRFAHSVKAWFFQSSIPFPGRAEREISFLCNVMKTFKSITIESDCSFLCSGFQINDAFNESNILFSTFDIKYRFGGGLDDK